MPDLVELIGDFGEWIEKAKEKVHEAVKEATSSTIEEVVRAAKELAPVDTGKLKDSIKGSVSAGGHFGTVKVSSKTVPYSWLVHFGTVKMPGRPFLYQAKEQVGLTYPKKIQDNIKQQSEAE